MISCLHIFLPINNVIKRKSCLLKGMKYQFLKTFFNKKFFISFLLETWFKMMLTGSYNGMLNSETASNDIFAYYLLLSRHFLVSSAPSKLSFSEYSFGMRRLSRFIIYFPTLQFVEQIVSSISFCIFTLKWYLQILNSAPGTSLIQA